MMINKLCLLLITCTCLCSCASTSQVKGGTANLSQLTKLRVEHAKLPASKINEIRLKALKDTALTLGAQSALAWRTKKINLVLNNNENQLNHIYNFAGMIMDQHVLPPVLVQANDTLNLPTTRTIRLADRIYEIKDQARFITMPPTWRDYLIMSYVKPTLPNRTLLPQNRREQKVWNKYVTQGWQQGLVQANEIYRENLARLNRDFTGMALYQKLLAEHMVSKPYVATTDLGVTGSKDALRINDRVLRITALPHFSQQTKQWRPVFIKDNH